MTLASVRFSHLKLIAKSALHFRYAVDEDSDQSLAMRLGSHCHALLFDQPLAVYHGKTRTGAAWKEFQTLNSGRTIVNSREHDEARRMADAVLANREAVELLACGPREQTIDWEVLGRTCSGTPDVRGREFVVELKTTRCSDPDRFVRDGLRRCYHAQLAWYMDGVIASGLGTPSKAAIVAVESAAPHPVTVLHLTDRAIDQGRRLCRLWMERLLSCEASDQWPGYAQSSVPFDVPDDDSLMLKIGGEEMEIS